MAPTNVPVFEHLHAIREIRACRPYRLVLTYDDGRTIEADIEPFIHRGGVFAPLADWDVFRNVRLGARGRSVCWPGDVDLCADALRTEATGGGESA